MLAAVDMSQQSLVLLDRYGLKGTILAVILLADKDLTRFLFSLTI